MHNMQRLFLIFIISLGYATMTVASNDLIWGGQFNKTKYLFFLPVKSDQPALYNTFNTKTTVQQPKTTKQTTGVNGNTDGVDIIKLK